MTSITKYTEQKCEFGGDDPGRPEPGIMQVFYEGEEPRGANYLCPCGCGNDIWTPVDKIKIERHWQFERGPNGPTLIPSIRWTGGCFAHFNITDGKVITHQDSGVKHESK